MRDDRYADNLSRLFEIGARDILTASYAIAEFEASIKNLPRKFRTSVVTGSFAGNGSGSVTADSLGDGSVGGSR